MIDFFPEAHIQVTDKKRFGICDIPPPPAQKAYIDNSNGESWIAIVDNFYEDSISFIPIDNCIEIRRLDGTMDNRCDGFLYYGVTVVFVELKQRSEKGNRWIREAEHQLRVTIGHFEKEEKSKSFSVKKAYIANSGQPYFRSSQAVRMDQFFMDTGYSLRIENLIKLY